MVAQLKAAVINEVTGVVVHEGLDHPALLASQNQGVQVRLKGGRELGANDRTENHNEGIAIATVIAGIRAQCADLCRDLKI